MAGDEGKLIMLQFKRSGVVGPHLRFAPTKTFELTLRKSRDDAYIIDTKRRPESSAGGWQYFLGWGRGGIARAPLWLWSMIPRQRDLNPCG